MVKRITNPLEKRRKNARVTQTEVAKALGVTQSHYSRIENGEAEPEPYLDALADFFDCEPNEIFAGNILLR